MKKIIGSSLVVMAGFFAACGGHTNEKAEVNSMTVIDSANDTQSTAKTYAVSLVDNKKDPTCGMPVTAGINDTAHYDGHVLGFCSSECKAEFLKNPKGAIAAAELKK